MCSGQCISVFSWWVKHGSCLPLHPTAWPAHATTIPLQSFFRFIYKNTVFTETTLVKHSGWVKLITYKRKVPDIVLTMTMVLPTTDCVGRFCKFEDFRRTPFLRLGNSRPLYESSARQQGAHPHPGPSTLGRDLSQLQIVRNRKGAHAKRSQK